MGGQSELSRARQRAEEQALDGAVEFRDGFTPRTMIGALFVAFIMLPGGILLGLVAGTGIGEAAEWVTIVLFAEVARRSFRALSKQEIYVLFYIAAALTSVLAIEKGIAGGPFGELIWRAYTAQSPAFEPIADRIPTWAVPHAGSDAIQGRTLLHAGWAVPILILILVEALIRVGWISMGYALFRLTSDVERLPFPLAPVAASGATALADAGAGRESWRWGVFTTGAAVGMVAGLLYLAVPIITGAVFGEGVQIFPIPFADYSKAVENVLPGALIGISFNIANVLTGFVLPWHVVIGATAGSVFASIVMNPILKSWGLLPSVTGGGPFITKLAADMDFWLSVGIGLNLAVAVLGILLIVRTLGAMRDHRRLSGATLAPPPGRGDIPIAWALAAWGVSSLGLILLCRWLIPDFPIWIIVFFGLLWSPINSYVSARMIGLTGRGLAFPMLRESALLTSRPANLGPWYAPMPIYDYGWAAGRFREVELTGTKFRSILKAEAFMFPIILIASLLFWNFFWKGQPFDGSQYPYAQRFWPIHAGAEAIWKQASLPGSDFQVAPLKAPLVGVGFAGGVALYGLFSVLKVPALVFYGFVSGVGLWPANTLPQALGAWVGRRYFARRYGLDTWTRYAPVLLAGFSCGSGLVAMMAIAFALVLRAVSTLPY